MTLDDVRNLLANEKDISTKLGERNDFVIASFEAAERAGIRQNVYVGPGSSGYLMVFAPVTAGVGPLETAAAEVLRIVVQESTKSVLAKADWFTMDDGAAFIMAASACSMDGLTSDKLRARMEAAAMLAVSVDERLKTLVDARRS